MSDDRHRESLPEQLLRFPPRFGGGFLPGLSSGLFYTSDGSIYVVGVLDANKNPLPFSSFAKQLPEPSTELTVGIGLLAFAFFRTRSRR